MTDKKEFCGEFEEAEKFYRQCKNFLSLTRVYCCLERIDDADKLANETGDPAACYHMARKILKFKKIWV